MENVIETGVLVRKSDLCKCPYAMMLLTNEHIQQVVDLEHYVLDNLDDKDMCLVRPINIVEESLNGNGIVVGVFAEEKLIAVRMLYFAGYSEYNLGRYLGIAANELENVVNMEFTAVHPDFRGNSLQKRMSEKALSIAQNYKGMRHICSMASPKNFPSILDKFSFNLHVAKLTEVYGGHWRYIFHKDVSCSALIRLDTITEAASDDYEKQKYLLEQGYLGFSLRNTRKCTAILFGQRAS